jgi:3-ketosteroid 9alpha-monooxygenase subunit A
MAIPKDGPFGKVRTWYSQFHKPRAEAARIQERVNGLVVTLDERTNKSAA